MEILLLGKSSHFYSYQIVKEDMYVLVFIYVWVLHIHL